MSAPEDAKKDRGLLRVVSLQIEPLSEADRPGAVEALARAFRDNPLNVAVIRSRDPAARTRCNVHGMRILLPVAQEHGLVLGAKVDGRVAGALVAATPFGYPLPPPALAARIRCLLGQGWGVARRWGRVFEALNALHPLEPMGYLGTLGVDPTLQTRGVGTALLNCWLESLDRESIGAYLEADREENLSFYRRAGFEVVGETRVEGVTVWRMQRRPQIPARAFDPPSH